MIHALVADTRTIRVFEASPPGRTLAEFAVFDAAAGRHERDLFSDRPGASSMRQPGVGVARFGSTHHGPNRSAC